MTAKPRIKTRQLKGRMGRQMAEGWAARGLRRTKKWGEGMWENRALPWQGRVKQLVRQASPLHQSSDLDKTRQDKRILLVRTIWEWQSACLTSGCYIQRESITNHSITLSGFQPVMSNSVAINQTLDNRYSERSCHYNISNIFQNK